MVSSAWVNGLLTVIWTALVLFTILDWDDYAALNCPQPWQLFLVVDYCLVLVMCALDWVGAYFQESPKIIKAAGVLAVINYSIMGLWVFVGTWFLAADWECLDASLNGEGLWQLPIRISGLIWLVCRWLVTCCLCCAVSVVLRAVANRRRRGENGPIQLVSLHRQGFQALREQDDDQAPPASNLASAA